MKGQGSFNLLRIVLRTKRERDPAASFPGPSRFVLSCGESGRRPPARRRSGFPFRHHAGGAFRHLLGRHVDDGVEADRFSFSGGVGERRLEESVPRHQDGSGGKPASRNVRWLQSAFMEVLLVCSGKGVDKVEPRRRV